MNLHCICRLYQALLFVAIGSVGFGSLAADRYAIESFVIAGGGGRSNPASGSRFAVTGTIGQTITAPVLQSPRGRYQVEPGFWQGIVIVQTPDAPELKIRPGTLGHVVLSWPVQIAGFVLEETSNVSVPGGWVPASGVVLDTATEHTVTIPASNTMKFYRLRRD